MGNTQKAKRVEIDNVKNKRDAKKTKSKEREDTSEEPKTKNKLKQQRSKTHAQNDQEIDQREKREQRARQLKKRTLPLPLNPVSDFDKFFPKLMKEIKNFETTTEISMKQQQFQKVDNKTLGTALTDFYDETMQLIVERVSEEMQSVLGGFWVNLKDQNQCAFASHVILVLWHALNDPLYEELSAEAKEIIKWSCLLHNIGKVGKPTITGKDHLYAFNSASIALYILSALIENAISV